MAGLSANPAISPVKFLGAARGRLSDLSGSTDLPFEHAKIVSLHNATTLDTNHPSSRLFADGLCNKFMEPGMYPTTSWIFVLVVCFWQLTHPAVATSQLTDTGKSKSTFTSTDIAEPVPAKLLKSKDSIRINRTSFYNPNTKRLNDLRLFCQIDFAATPKLTTFSAKTKQGVVRRDVYSANLDDVSYSLEVVEYPMAFLEARDLDIVNKPFQVLERQLDTLKNAHEGCTERTRRRVIAQLPGMQMLISHPAGKDKKSNPIPEGLVLQRSYVSELSVYSAKIAMSKGTYDKDSLEAKKLMSQFVESLNIGGERMKWRFKPLTRAGGVIGNTLYNKK